MKKERKVRVYAFSCAATVFLGSVSETIIDWTAL